MRLGIFAKTFLRATVEEVFDAVKDNGLECLQFNCSCLGLPTLPDLLPPALVNQVRSGMDSRSLEMAAVSGTCNLIHPNLAIRSRDLGRLESLIGACPPLGKPVVTLCTGTRDFDDMWRWHPDNGSLDAWRDLVQSLERLLPVAHEAGVILGIEPEPANVINSAAKARKLLDELRSPSLKIVFDAANLLSPDTICSQSRTLSEAAELLGPDIVLAHAKDLGPDLSPGHLAAGRGSLDYPLYLSVLQTAGFNGPLILHNLSETEVPDAVRFLRRHLAR